MVLSRNMHIYTAISLGCHGNCFIPKGLIGVASLRRDIAITLAFERDVFSQVYPHFYLCSLTAILEKIQPDSRGLDYARS